TLAMNFERLLASCPHAASLLGEGCDGATFAVGRVPYGFVRRSTDGPYYLGDQAAVIASFCGEGMGIALTSGASAASSFLEGAAAGSFQAAFARRVGMRVRAMGLLSRAMCSTPMQPLAPALAGALPSAISGVASAVRSPVP
ncbi:MAG: FAD-binding monooxygenase, partial [Pseudomonadota bacterium]